MKSLFTVYVIFLLVSFSVKEGGSNGEKRTCPKSSIQVIQGPSGSTHYGIPQYNVMIMNGCESSCSGVHLSCGQFVSANFINPKIFNRIVINDCLVNNGAPIKFGQILSFTYSNTFKYPITVTSATCH
ncbi:hypothetical protein R3W88_028508 [Solanum pinnatisectum]|uniref:Uncharacterized protein n=1 Tax=Solanum pinnatisectum TaxID=50273 RepID=A0AAV9K333_9SOLN|nr:hypothetical protein R3W88_028508 [Solanum pinnatisectum]